MSYQARGGKLPIELKHQLAMIEPSTPSGENSLRIYPCAGRLRDGTRLERICLVAEFPFVQFAYAGAASVELPQNQVSIKDIVQLTESPHRIPARFANQLYEAGETGMGYTSF